MEIMDMIKLAKDGISASDVIALNKAGYTPEIIEELKNNGMQSDEVIQKAQDQQEANQQREEESAKLKEEKAAITEALEAATKQIEDLKKQIAEIQADNRGQDMEGELPDPDEYKKNLEDYISSKM